MYICNLSMLRQCLLNHVSDNKNIVSKDLLISKVEEIDSLIFAEFCIPKDEYYIICNGKKINISEPNLNTSSVLHVIPRTLGGKGGFGSMLRAIGAQIEKTTNREACRDLSGRRLRDINEEQRLKNWISQQADREKEAAERKKKKLERLCQEPKHDFKDEKYDESRSVMTDKMSCSIEQGFKARPSSSCTITTVPNIPEKRKLNRKECANRVPAKKKKTLWIDADVSDSSSSESSDVDEKDSTCGKNNNEFMEAAADRPRSSSKS